jgi:hypothetical protein
VNGDLTLCQPQRPTSFGDAGAQLFGMNHVALSPFAYQQNMRVTESEHSESSDCDQPCPAPHGKPQGGVRVGCAMMILDCVLRCVCDSAQYVLKDISRANP